MADTEFDQPLTLVGELAIAYRELGKHEGLREDAPVCVRLLQVDPDYSEPVTDGDMLRIVDVKVVPDEVGAHIEIIVIPDGADPTLIG